MKVFITGLTGTLGTALAQLHRSRGDEVTGCARSEDRAARWIRAYPRLGTLILADAASLADRSSAIGHVVASVDRIYHCAAMKHVDLCEENPHEAFDQNVRTTCLIAEACERAGTPLMFSSTDKACLPQSVYGATKFLGERVVLHCGGAAARLGNIIASSGSVFRLWAESNSITLTDPDMTRFFLTVGEAAALLAAGCAPGRLTIPRLRAVRMGDVADRLAARGNRNVRVIGRRRGETQHQWLDVLPDGPENEWSRSDTAPRWEVAALLNAAGVGLLDGGKTADSAKHLGPQHIGGA